MDFDDSIIEDTNTTIDRNVKLVNAGLRSKKTAIMEINKCSEQEAEKELQEIAEESQINGAGIDWYGQEGEDEQESENDTPKEKKEQAKKEMSVEKGDTPGREKGFVSR